MLNINIEQLTNGIMGNMLMIDMLLKNAYFNIEINSHKLF